MLLEIKILVKALKSVKLLFINCEDRTKEIFIGIFVDPFDFTVNNSLSLGFSYELVKERFQILSRHQFFKKDYYVRHEFFLEYFLPNLSNLTYLLSKKQKLS